jgi:transposase-like protein
MSNPRKQYSSAFKAKIVTEALRETKTVAQLASEYQLHPNLITKWKQAALEALPTVFERENKHQQAQADHERKSAELYEQIGRLTQQVTWLKKKSGLDTVPD